jgi:fatty acid/phospholipid biosynthesis enzyme
MMMVDVGAVKDYQPAQLMEKAAIARSTKKSVFSGGNLLLGVDDSRMFTILD